jgi:hypothetical protein
MFPWANNYDIGSKRIDAERNVMEMLASSPRKIVHIF